MLPEGDTDFSSRWNRIKGLFSKHYRAHHELHTDSIPSRRHRGETTIWQRRFWEHCIRDEDDLHCHLDYIHFNPVRHGQVSRPADWPWSSLTRYLCEGWYSAERGAQEPQSLHGMSGFGE